MIHLTDERVDELLDAAVADRGADYVYATEDGIKVDGHQVCKYVHHVYDRRGNRDNPQPGCIIGHVLHNGGLTLRELEGLEGSAFGVPFNDEEEVHWGSLVKVSQKSSNLLTDVQGYQDTGMSWSEAVERARRENA